MNINIGGDRLGSGNKMNTELRNYSRSSHNLSEKWTSSMAPGVLYPFLVKPAMNGDTFDIDLEAALVTLPTQGPLYGSFKMQADIFVIPMRLYIGFLHNNPTNIGMQMNQIYMPVMRIEDNADRMQTNENEFSNSCLMKYLGLSGLGHARNWPNHVFYRDINAIPMLGYYDVFKNFYSNKMEKKCYVIVPSDVENRNNSIIAYKVLDANGKEIEVNNDLYDNNIAFQNSFPNGTIILITEGKLEKTDIEFDIKVVMRYFKSELVNGNWTTTIGVRNSPDELVIKSETFHTAEPKLQAFDLENIDDMRMAILTEHTKGRAFMIDKTSALPYSTNCKRTTEAEDRYSNNCYPMNGLMVKTYQSDMFNSFVQTEWIDGSNGIAELTAIDVSDGKLRMDALNLQQKLYNVMNRIAVSGGTYEDWQEAVWSQKAIRKSETPIYCGGLSKEIAFQQIVQTTPTDGDPLGTLGGRGVFTNKHKGGHVIVKVTEPSFIMGIVSITPRIRYSQGNEFYLTELHTMDDLHKPELDGIGFEDLIGERAAWFDTTIVPKNQQRPQDGYDLIRNGYGKLPAWINYMTSVDKVFGDFANQGGKSFMTLSRQYEVIIDPALNTHIKDFTTYIDPAKYNYAFANAELTAQNFWVEIESKIIARRIMSAKVIPNL